MVKFAGKEYPDNITLSELVKRLEIEGTLILSYEKELTAQEILNDL